jgi:hypothetical protein
MMTDKSGFKAPLVFMLRDRAAVLGNGSAFERLDRGVRRSDAPRAVLCRHFKHGLRKCWF